MKRRHFLYTILIGTLLTGSGCQNYLAINVDPNRPNDASLPTLLPTVIQGTASFDYNAAYVACQYVQQIGGGVDDQSTERMEGAWSTLYLTQIPNLTLLVQKGQAANSPSYVGIAKTLMAHNIGMATTYWENIPYSSANIDGTFRPTFDTQEQIVAKTQTLLDEAIVALKASPASDAPVGPVPGADDLAYGGDLTKWIKLAYTLKARFTMNTSKKNVQQAATTALAALANGMTGTADDFQLVYNTGLINPWTQIALANYTGNITISQGYYFINLLNTTIYPVADPRLPLVAGSLKTGYVYATPLAYQGTRSGAASGRNVDFTKTTFNTTATAPIQLVTFAEAKLLEAEARFLANGGTRTSRGSTPEAYAAYLAGIRANLTKIGVTTADANAFLANAAVAVTATGLKLENIMTEKYKVLFLNPQVWTDVRRYDFDPTVFRDLSLPDKQFISVDANGTWAQRVLYPTSETARNAAVTQQNFKPITEKMWLFQ